MKPTPLEQDRCDAFRRAIRVHRQAKHLLDRIQSEDEHQVALAHLEETRLEVAEAAQVLRSSLVAKTLDHAGHRYYRDATGITHMVKLAPSVLMQQAGGST